MCSKKWLSSSVKPNNFSFVYAKLKSIFCKEYNLHRLAQSVAFCIEERKSCSLPFIWPIIAFVLREKTLRDTKFYISETDIYIINVYKLLNIKYYGTSFVASVNVNTYNIPHRYLVYYPMKQCNHFQQRQAIIMVKGSTEETL